VHNNAFGTEDVGVYVSEIIIMSGSNKSNTPDVVDFAAASEKHRAERKHQQREEKVDAIRQQFERAFSEPKKPVKEYLRKKKAKKKR